MKNTIQFALVFFVFALTSCANEKAAPTPDVIDKSEEKKDKIAHKEKEITFKTNDGILIYGDLYESEKTAPIILLFHQARGSARGEYATIIPRLTNKGYNVLAIDQRSGGDQFTIPNRTVAQFPEKSYGYCDAYPDLEAAVKYVKSNGFVGKTFVWGSSYSAGLAINLGNQYVDDIDGVLAFSPASGGPMKDCSPQSAIESISSPLIIFRPAKEMEVPSVIAQFESAKQKGHETFIAENGVHGSSMLVAERTNSEVKETWSAVFAFIEKVAGE